MKLIIGALLALLFVFGLRSIFSHVMTAATQDTSACLALEGSTSAERNGTYYITGTVRNNCDRRFSNVTVSFKVDKQSEQAWGQPLLIGYARNLESHGSATFETSSGTANPPSYRLESLNGF